MKAQLAPRDTPAPAPGATPVLSVSRTIAELCQLLLSNKISAASKGFPLERCHHNVEVMRLRERDAISQLGINCNLGLQNPAKAQVQTALQRLGHHRNNLALF